MSDTKSNDLYDIFTSFINELKGAFKIVKFNDKNEDYAPWPTVVKGEKDGEITILNKCRDNVIQPNIKEKTHHRRFGGFIKGITMLPNQWKLAKIPNVDDDFVTTEVIPAKCDEINGEYNYTQTVGYEVDFCKWLKEGGEKPICSEIPIFEKHLYVDIFTFNILLPRGKWILNRDNKNKIVSMNFIADSDKLDEIKSELGELLKRYTNISKDFDVDESSD